MIYKINNQSDRMVILSNDVANHAVILLNNLSDRTNQSDSDFINIIDPRNVQWP